MSKHVYPLHILRKHWSLVSLFCAAFALMILPDLAHAADALPFETPLKALTKALTGPVAFTISVVGIVAAGAVLIFGGEMSGFLRTIVFLVLVVAVVVNAGSIITFVGGTDLSGGAAAALVPLAPDVFRGVG